MYNVEPIPAGITETQDDSGKTIYLDDKGNVISKKTLKRMQKQARKLEHRKADVVVKKVSKVEETDPVKYTENRITSLAESGITTYPSFQASFTISEFNELHSSIAVDSMITGVATKLCGRIMRKHSSSSKLIFYDLYQNGHKVQIMASKNESSEPDTFIRDHELIKRGDIVSVIGFPTRTKTGELSLMSSNIQLLAPCLHIIPPASTGFKHQEARYRQRYLDLIVNSGARDTFVTRSKIVKNLRSLLDDQGFLEVETPILNAVAGGATAKPFKTYHNDLRRHLYMRVAPELYLKQLVIGGFDRVYEIGRCFRNEGIDLTHNPEFTSCEFYMAYSDYRRLMIMTEIILVDTVSMVTGGKTVIEYDGQIINFAPPYKHFPLVQTLRETYGIDIPDDLNTEQARLDLIEESIRIGVQCTPPLTTARILDKFVSHFIEPTCINPTFITDHPQIMSPLAKNHRSTPGLTERFELFIAGKEICNAYTELNDPDIQRERFAAQKKDVDLGDDEAQTKDELFCTALEYGLPPTAGWGMGIDRLTMMLTNQQNIKEVVLFPAMRDD